MSNKIQIVWDKLAINDLKDIFEFNSQAFSIDFAIKARTEIIELVSGIRFAKQWQYDDILSKPYRRMLIRHYRIVYLENKNTIQILRVFDSRQNPKELKNSLK